MTYEQLEAGTDDGRVPMRVRVRPECDGSDNPGYRYGTATIEYTNRVRVKWDDGRTTREYIETLEAVL